MKISAVAFARVLVGFFCAGSLLCACGQTGASSIPGASARLAASAGSHGGLRRMTPPGESVPADGCNFYPNGDVQCAAGCSGYEANVSSSGYTAVMTCDVGGDSDTGSFGIGGSGVGAGVGSPGGGGGGITGLSGYGPPILTAAEKIYNAALGMKGMATRPDPTCTPGVLGLYNAPCRNECVAATQYALKSAGLSQMLTTNGSVILGVDQFVSALLISGYVETSNPSPGDIVDLNGDHVGIYLGNGIMMRSSRVSGKFAGALG